MKRSLAHVAVVVKDYDEAIRFYVNKLNFKLVEDTVLSDVKRWVLVAPSDEKGCCLLLAKAANEKQSASIGNQTGGRVFLFMYTDDFYRDFNAMQNKGVVFIREPKVEPYGTVAVFEDLYGNLWDLIQPT